MKRLLMLGTHLDTMGGIASVVKVYRDAGLLDRLSVRYLATHCDGGALRKLAQAAGSWLCFIWYLLCGQVSGLHVHVASRASFWRKSLFLWPAFACRLPVVLHLHGAEFHRFYDEECGWLAKRLIRSVFERVRVVIVLSASWQAWVQGMCGNQRIEVLFNPVMLPETVAAWGERKPGVVLTLGRLGTRKGSFDLLAAAATLVPQHAELQLRLGGDGAVREVAVRAAELGIAERVELLGWVSGEVKMRELSRAMVYALPSFHEGLPMSVLEAMAAGVPVLATRVGGIPEAVTDGVEGFLIEPGDVDALADRISLLLSDPALAQRMGEAARRKVETTFSADVLLPQLEALYEELGVNRNVGA